jgi:hypothetical protein
VSCLLTYHKERGMADRKFSFVLTFLASWCCGIFLLTTVVAAGNVIIIRLQTSSLQIAREKDPLLFPKMPLFTKGPIMYGRNRFCSLYGKFEDF